MAYGINGPFGLQCVGTLGAYTPSGKVNPYSITSGFASSIFEGDRVALVNGSLVVAPAGTPSIGVFNAVQYVDQFGTYQSLPFWAANTVTYNAAAAVALVNDDPLSIFDVQVSNSVNTLTLSNYAVLSTMVGLNANLSIGGGGAFPQPGPVALNPTTGSTRTGQSGYYLDFSTINSDSTLDVKIVGLTPRPGNAFALPFNNVIVTLNNDSYRGTGVGNNIDSLKITSLTAGATYTALISDEVIDSFVSATVPGPMAITIPAASAVNRGKQYVIKDAGGHAGTGGLNITVIGANIDGATPLTIAANFGHVRIISDGTSWFTI